MKCRQHGNPPIPEATGCPKLRQQFTVRLLQVGSHDIRGARINQIPVVDPLPVAEVQPKQRVADRSRAALVLTRENQQAQETLFVKPGPYERLDGTRGQIATCPRHQSCLWNHHAEKAIAFSVFSWTCLEEALKTDRLRRIGMRSKESAGLRGLLHAFGFASRLS